MRENQTGEYNTAIGTAALYVNKNGSHNTVMGTNAMWLASGNYNTISGAWAMPYSSGSNNSAFGAYALDRNGEGEYNTAIGFKADLINGFNIINNATAIGSGAIVDASNKVRIGNAAVTVIEGQVPFTTPSDGRFKFNVTEDVKGLDFILQLRPITYQFDVKRFDDLLSSSDSSRQNISMNAAYDKAKHIRRSGFIAQEVEQAAMNTNYNFSGIIKPESPGGHYSLSYDAFVVPLVKAVQELTKKVETLQKELDALKKEK
jgi:hypothetical protein